MRFSASNVREGPPSAVALGDARRFDIANSPWENHFERTEIVRRSRG
jgi:hypothetical protein